MSVFSVFRVTLSICLVDQMWRTLKSVSQTDALILINFFQLIRERIIENINKMKHKCQMKDLYIEGIFWMATPDSGIDFCKWRWWPGVEPLRTPNNDDHDLLFIFGSLSTWSLCLISRNSEHCKTTNQTNQSYVWYH